MHSLCLCPGVVYRGCGGRVEDRTIIKIVLHEGSLGNQDTWPTFKDIMNGGGGGSGVNNDQICTRK
jgi:hypothetical protein